MAVRDGGLIVKRSATIAPGTNDIEPRPDALYIGGAGSITVTWEDNTTDTIPGLLGGNIYPYAPKKITAATATDIKALYFADR